MMEDALQKPSLTLRRRLQAPPARVYAAFTDPARILKWWGPEGSTTLEAETDVRPGGRYRVTFRMADGTVHEVAGSYVEVEPGRRLAFDWEWPSDPSEPRTLVTVTFEPDEAGTVLTLTHEGFADGDARDCHKDGWTGTLVRLEAFLAEG